MIHALAGGALAIILAASCGCASQARRDALQETRAITSTARGLVLPPAVDFEDLSVSVDDLYHETMSWEFSRNDTRLGIYSVPKVDALEIVEVRHREYLRTINGRPRDYSSTITRSIKRGASR